MDLSCSLSPISDARSSKGDDRLPTAGDLATHALITLAWARCFLELVCVIGLDEEDTRTLVACAHEQGIEPWQILERLICGSSIWTELLFIIPEATLGYQ